MKTAITNMHTGHFDSYRFYPRPSNVSLTHKNWCLPSLANNHAARFGLTSTGLPFPVSNRVAALVR
ncbi:hypothetical protein BN2475_340048 [Paraburkholderia ribeironis]|uniref:Uncharacterized protein n=1 Tax=Paraburkholderia ribeironis TaxID=1247936 RepID=A0A1N7S3N3_9BURK|nr:hypothetical protein BN2475_340048 [Paraburkholderia ribeironis]